MSDTQNDESTVREIVAGRARAMNEGNAAAVIDACSRELVLYNLAPPLKQPVAPSREAAIAELQGWFDGHGGRVGYEVTDLDVTVSGDLAVCTSIDRLGSPEDTSGQEFSMWFRHTLVLRREGDSWTIVHDHESTPFYMDGSFKAALDLEPE